MSERKCLRCGKDNPSYTTGRSICPECDKIIKEKQALYEEEGKERVWCVDIGMGCNSCGYTGLDQVGDGPCVDCLDYPDFGFCD